MTLYQIKPLFQSLLRPTMFWLYKHHVTANHITLAALALSLITGLLLMLVTRTTHPLFAIAHRAFYPYGAQCAGWHVGA